MRNKRSVSVRELGERATEILREVRVKRATIQVTDRGKVIAQLIPARTPRSVFKPSPSVWRDLDHLAAEIGAHWPNDVSAADAVREGRREL
jgi:antitoxin (DNA-binding transcriptional repressor) of toxin-antitoxin stability system